MNFLVDTAHSDILIYISTVVLFVLSKNLSFHP